MTAEHFYIFWNADYPDTVLIQEYFKYIYAERWFRLHSLPQSKRYADDELDWRILLERHNQIITDLLNDDPHFLLVTGEYVKEGYTELHRLEHVDSIKGIVFVPLMQIDLHKFRPDEYEPDLFYMPIFSEQKWAAGEFDGLLKDMANANIRAFLVSRGKGVIIAPYDGGIDIILKDTKTRDYYKNQYKRWLSGSEDGL